MSNDACPSCGAKMRRYRHHFNKGLASALVALYEHAGGDPVKAASLGLTHNHQANFQKLQYWGVVERVKGARWRITDKGRDIVLGHDDLPESVWTHRKKVMVPEAGEAPDWVYIQNVLPGYQQRKDYAAEARTTIGRDEMDGTPSLFR